MLESWTNREFDDVVWDVTFTSDGQRLVALCNKPGEEHGKHAAVRIWRAGLEKPERTLLLRGTAYATPSTLCVSLDSRLVACGRETIRIWELATGKAVVTLEGHTDQVQTLSFSPDSAFLASGSVDSTVRIWSMRKRQAPRVIKHGYPVGTVVFGSDGENLFTGCLALNKPEIAMGGLQRIELGTDKVFQYSLAGKTTPNWWGAGLSPDGKYLAAAMAGYRSFGVFEIKSGKSVAILQHTLVSHGSRAVFLGGGKLLAGIGAEEIAFFQVPSWKPATKKIKDAASPAAVAPDSSCIAFTPLGKGGARKGRKDALVIREL